MPGMKENTIKLVIRKKMTNWLESIEDSAVKSLAERDAFVTGGAIASMLLGEKVNDYDIYFKTKETAKAVAEYYVAQFNAANQLQSVNKYSPVVEVVTRKNIKGEEEERVLIYMKSAGVAGEDQEEYTYFEYQDETLVDQFVESLDINNALDAAEAIVKVAKNTEKPYRPVFLSENAITLHNKIQLIVRFFGDPAEVHKNYDFVHATNYYLYNENELVLFPDALKALLTKTLVYNGSMYPVASVFRLRKFYERGWRISAGQILKILFQISAVDLNDSKILREQLIGVDTAFMKELLKYIQSADERIDQAYLVKLIDKIFG